jgi:hypothetical protein
LLRNSSYIHISYEEQPETDHCKVLFASFIYTDAAETYYIISRRVMYDKSAVIYQGTIIQQGYILPIGDMAAGRDDSTQIIAYDMIGSRCAIVYMSHIQIECSVLQFYVHLCFAGVRYFDERYRTREP